MKANSLLCMIIHFLAINPSQANSNKRTQDGASSSIPTALDNSKSGFPSFYELTKSGTFGISTKVPIYLRYFASDGLPGDNKTYTSSFEVNVDDYSQLVVPSSIQLQIPPKVENAYRKMSMLLYQTDEKTGVKTVVCSPTPRSMWARSNGQDYVVQYRSILITVSQGRIVGCDWAPSSCILQPTSLAVDSICADACPGANCNYNITMFIAWTGTDSSGSSLTSFNRDMYRLVNAFN